jgi:hypothetical protein
MTEGFLTESHNSCKMFWCYPTPLDDNSFKWEVLGIDTNDVNMDQFRVLLHKLKLAWKDKDFANCGLNSLPCGVVKDGYCYHGNNFPAETPLENIVSDFGYNLGNEVVPMVDPQFSVKEDELRALEKILGHELGISTTDF